MSEEQALENQDDIVDETLDENPAEPEDALKAAEEVEIIVEGEEKPASKPHTSGFQKRLKRMKGKIDASDTKADEATRRAEMLEEENKLLRLQSQQSKPATRPKEDDFEEDRDYQNALEEYDNARIERIATEKASQIVHATQTQAATLQTEGNLNQQIDEHYTRSAGLKVPDYEETEAVAADILGDDVAKQIVANTDKSHLLMYHLGKNPGKAEKLKSLLDSNPLKGVLEIGRLAGSLSLKPKNATPPNPETNVEGGTSPDPNKRGPKGARYE